ncbi:unnamed protein product, partial [Didymodactylos carnosus]
LTPTTNILSPNNLIGGPLIPNSTLEVFIRFQLFARGGTSDVGRPLTNHPLAEPIVLVDEFDTWHFDHLHNLFELNLLSPNKTFPRKWKLNSNTQIFYLFELSDDGINPDQEDELTVRNVDRPSTISFGSKSYLYRQRMSPTML